MRDIIIIGGGTAGLTAGIYGARMSMDILLFEGAVFGGQIANTPHLENYPSILMTSGQEYSDNMLYHATELGVETKKERVESFQKNDDGTFTVTTKRDTYQARSIILALGCTPRPIGVENESSYIGRGLSFCAQCDGNFFRKKHVAVIGGGNTAFEDALLLSNIAEKVYIVHRRQGFSADASNVEAIKATPNIELVLDSVVTSINGEKVIESITTHNSATNKDITIPVSGVFGAVGQIPAPDLSGGKLTLTKSGYVDAGEDCHTNIEGLYVAGDLRQKPLRQLVTATADGAVAALAASDYALRHR